MERIRIKDLKMHEGKEVAIAGWVDSRRSHGKLIFTDIRDGSGILQTVSSPKGNPKHDDVAKLRDEWTVIFTGTLNKRPDNMVNQNVEMGDLELSITGVEILSDAAEMPFEKNADLNIDTYFDYMPLTLRRARSLAIFRVQTAIINAFRQYLTHAGFTEFQAPKLIGEDAEGGASSFEVDYFGYKAHLAQSPQFYKQIMVGVFERVFTTGNVYRAERHSTTRHLNEYTSLDIEMGFIKDHTDVMKVANGVLEFIAQELRRSREADFKLLGAEIPNVPEKIPSYTLREAQAIIRDNYGEDPTNEPDLTPQHERWLHDYVQKNFNSDFVFVTHFPSEKRPMYVYDDPEVPGFTKSFDLLFRGLEIITGGQRIHKYDDLVAKMQKKNLNPEKFAFYLQAFKYGMPPHGGFGMGLERLTAKFLGIDNVKEATLFPREINRIDSRLHKEGE